ncbi:MAG: cell division protein FtsH, partial [Selenomonas sp.]|nr:cell division protein FtsH [Selenomonas sp.]
LAGPERKSHVMTDEEKRLTAYHEGGHTLVGLLLEHADPVHKVTIIPRGRAGGYMLSLPKEDRSYRTRSELIDRIKVALGGRVAEEVVLGEISTGASSDIQQATRIIRSMIMEYGMSDAIGPIAYGEENHQVFLGRDLNRERNYSEEIAGEIDREVRRYIEEAYEACRTIIVENRDKLDLIAKELLERETLSAAELEELMTKGAISEKDKQNDDTDDTGKPAPIPVDVVIDDSTQTSEEAERAAEKRPAPVAAPEPKFNVTQWDK